MVDPLSAVVQGNMSTYLMIAGDYEEAEVAAQRAFELSPDMWLGLEVSLSGIRLLQGRE